MSNELTPLENILETLASATVEGATGLELDEMAGHLIKVWGCEPAFLGYSPVGFQSSYPNVICVSLNGEVIHGIPDDRGFQDGDVVKIDIGLKDKDGQYDDGATTVVIGKASAAVRRLIKGTKAALAAGVAVAKPGNTTNDIAAAIEAVAKEHDLAVIENYGGHGIGDQLHMEPHIPNKVTHEVPAVTLVKGQRIAIEPMFSTNRATTGIMPNGWTVKIIGGGIAAHFEKTVTI